MIALHCYVDEDLSQKVECYCTYYFFLVKDKFSLAFSISVGLTFFILKIQKNWGYPSAHYDQYKSRKSSCNTLRDVGITLGSSLSGSFIICLPQKEI